MKHAAWIVLFAALAPVAWAQKPPKSQDMTCEREVIKKVKFDEKCGGYISPGEEKTRLDKEGKCVKCLAAPVEHECCEKVYYRCKTCGHVDKKAGTCSTASCKKAKYERLVDYSRMLWRCPGICMKTSEKDGAKCEDRDCDGFNKKYVKICSKSPSEPHNKDF